MHISVSIGYRMSVRLNLLLSYSMFFVANQLKVRKVFIEKDQRICL